MPPDLTEWLNAALGWSLRGTGSRQSLPFVALILKRFEAV